MNEEIIPKCKQRGLKAITQQRETEKLIFCLLVLNLKAK